MSITPVKKPTQRRKATRPEAEVVKTDPMKTLREYIADTEQLQDAHNQSL
jgi:hypothetical protein